MTNEEALEKCNSLLKTFEITNAVAETQEITKMKEWLKVVKEALEKQTAYTCDGCKYDDRSGVEVPCCYCDRWGEDEYERSNDESTI